jgi:GAF domain-containing protein
VKPTVTEREQERLEALRVYRILDTQSERAFDDLTALVAYVCNVPIALVSLVDSHRQWFKSKFGLEATETSRDVSFCTHAILQDKILVIKDTLLDSRFAANPLVISEPDIRFYAGVPLPSPEALPLGTLCVIDHEPRELNAFPNPGLGGDRAPSRDPAGAPAGVCQVGPGPREDLTD